MTTSFKMPCACTATLTAPSPAAGHCRPALLLETPGHSKASLGQSLVGSLLLSPGSCYTQGFGFFSLQEPVSPVLCEFWQLFGAVNSDLLQEGLCHTQVFCTQSPCPWVRPLRSIPRQKTHKHSKAGLAWSLGSSCVHKVYNELSKCLWWVQGLILNVISHLRPSCWGFSFALGGGISFFFWLDPTFSC